MHGLPVNTGPDGAVADSHDGLALCGCPRWTAGCGTSSSPVADAGPTFTADLTSGKYESHCHRSPRRSGTASSTGRMRFASRSRWAAVWARSSTSRCAPSVTTPLPPSGVPTSGWRPATASAFRTAASIRSPRRGAPSSTTASGRSRASPSPPRSPAEAECRRPAADTAGLRPRAGGRHPGSRCSSPSPKPRPARLRGLPAGQRLCITSRPGSPRWAASDGRRTSPPSSSSRGTPCSTRWGSPARSSRTRSAPRATARCSPTTPSPAQRSGRGRHRALHDLHGFLGHLRADGCSREHGTSGAARSSPRSAAARATVTTLITR